MSCCRIIAVLAVSAAITPLARGGDLPDILKRGTIKVIAAADEDAAMFSFQPGPNPGFERELIEGFAALHKLKVEAVAAPTYNDRIPLLTSGAGDVIIGMIETEDRRKLVDFTPEVLPARHAVASHAPNPEIKTVEELKAAKVGLLKGTSWAQAALEAGVSASDAEMFTDRDQMLAALKAGKITATVMSVSDLALAMKKDPGLRGGVFVGTAAVAAWGIRKQDDQLERALAQYLENSRKSATWSRLVVKYFGEQALTVLGRSKNP